MELEDLITNLESDASAIKELVMDLQEHADEYNSNKIHAVSVLADHQRYLLGQWKTSGKMSL